MSDQSLHPGDDSLERILNWFPTILTALVLIGALVISAPSMVPGGPGLSPIDALFTMTSAVTCTGLWVRNPAGGFTDAGHVVLILFTLAGALLYMIAGAAIAFRLRRRLEGPGTGGAAPPPPTLASLVAGVVFTALACAALGALLLFPLWHVPTYLEGGEAFWRRVYYSLFHAASAFCNSGLSLQSDSLVEYRHTLLPHGVIAPLIVLGGLGYPVLQELGPWCKRRVLRLVGAAPLSGGGPSAALSRYSKLAIGMTAALYLAGVVGIAAAQLKPQLDARLHGTTEGRAAGAPLTARTLGMTLSDASFTSLSARSTGFRVMPLDEGSAPSDWLQPAGRFVLLPLMLIGAAPGSAAGGMSMIALGLLLVAAWAAMSGRGQAGLFGRPVDDGLVRFALGMLVGWVGLACLAMFLLSLSEPYPPGTLLFTSASAAGNAGLSLGSLGELTAFGKATVAGTMLLGRLGGLVLMGEMALAAAGQATAANEPGASPDKRGNQAPASLRSGKRR